MEIPLLLLLLLSSPAYLRWTTDLEEGSGTESTSLFTTPSYWSCCLHQRVPGSDPLAGLYRLYFGDLPQLLPQCRDSCVYEKLGEDNGSLYCFTYENAIHFPVCEDPEPDTTLEEDISTTEGFQPFPPFPL